jgi:hypothetical protein
MNQKAKFLIFSPPYSDKVGGIVALHALAHKIKKLGFE